MVSPSLSSSCVLMPWYTMQLLLVWDNAVICHTTKLYMKQCRRLVYCIAWPIIPIHWSCTRGVAQFKILLAPHSISCVMSCGAWDLSHVSMNQGVVKILSACVLQVWVRLWKCPFRSDEYWAFLRPHLPSVPVSRCSPQISRPVADSVADLCWPQV